MSDKTMSEAAGRQKLIPLDDESYALAVMNVDSNGDAASEVALPEGTNRSGSIAVGGAAQVLAAANPSRKGLKGQNISSGDLWINETGGTAAADTAGSWKVPSGSTFSIGTSRAISIVGATTGQKFTATEF